jgi:RNA polymerase sigma factor (sigma-70 family)
MHNLEESFRHIIHLKYIEEYSYEEIANTTWLSQDAIRQRISRGIKRLQEMLSHLK